MEGKLQLHLTRGPRRQSIQLEGISFGWSLLYNLKRIIYSNLYNISGRCQTCTRKSRVRWNPWKFHGIRNQYCTTINISMFKEVPCSLQSFHSLVQFYEIDSAVQYYIIFMWYFYVLCTVFVPFHHCYGCIWYVLFVDGSAGINSLWILLYIVWVCLRWKSPR